MSGEELKEFRKLWKAIFDSRFGKNTFYKDGEANADHYIVYTWKVKPAVKFAIKSFYRFEGGAPVLYRVEVLGEAKGVYAHSGEAYWKP